MSRVPSLGRQVAVAALGLVAIAASLWAGIGIPLMLIMTPNPGQETIVLVLKIVLIVGWLVMLGWLWFDLVAGRLRFLLAAIGAWVWVGAALTLLRGFAFLNIGY